MDIKVRAEDLNNSNLLVGVFHNNVAIIKEHRKPLKITHAAYSKLCADKHSKMLKTALNKPMRANLITDDDKQIIAEGNWQELHFMNPHRIVPCCPPIRGKQVRILHLHFA